MGLDNDLYTLLNGSWNTIGPITSYTPGYQEFGLTGKIASSLTGLTLMGPIYSFMIIVDGGTPIEVAFMNADTITYGNLIDKLNTWFLPENCDVPAVASLVGGDVRITSNSTLITSSISITDVGITGGFVSLLTALSAPLDVAVAAVAVITPLITKPTFHLNQDKPRVQTRHFYIQTQFKGKFGEEVHDSSLSGKNQPFELTFHEGSEYDIIKALRVTKTLLMNASISSGKYHITEFDITEINQLKKCILKGQLNQFIASDEF